MLGLVAPAGWLFRGNSGNSNNGVTITFNYFLFRTANQNNFLTSFLVTFPIIFRGSSSI